MTESNEVQDAQVQKIINLVQEFDLTDSASWSDIDALATQVSVDGIEVDPEGVVLYGNGKFDGIFNLYLKLQYGSDSNDGFISSDSFLGRFEGHFEKGGLSNNDNPVIDSLSVDTTRFYETYEGPR